jgi:Lysyl oxidase
MAVRARFSLASAALALLTTAIPAGAHVGTNPCTGPRARHLLCPNLRIGRPDEIYVERRGDRTLLRATSNVKSRGRGAIELRGHRDGWHTMRVNERIHRVGGGRLVVRTRAKLHFTDVGSYFGGSYWKVHQLARFELWKVDRHHAPVRRVRVGPKLNYCLRDLERTRPGRRSPASAHYPGCNQDPFTDAVTLGTSVGWSDIYPADYDKQWINVSGLRGCFAFMMRVDPHNLLYESNERDNHSRRLLRLPYPGQLGC